jgi:anthranilate phosphoribosyltransferase
MRHVAQVRRALGVPTLFNFLGPLCNPARAEFQLLGVGKEGLQEKIAAAVAQLPIERGLIVRGLDGMDEVSLSAETRVFHVKAGKFEESTWSPSDFGLSRIDVADLYAENPQESAAIIRQMLSGQRGPPRDIVLANAAAGIWLVGLESDLPSAVARCAEAIDCQAASDLLEQLSKLSHRDAV